MASPASDAGQLRSTHTLSRSTSRTGMKEPLSLTLSLFHGAQHCCLRSHRRGSVQTRRRCRCLLLVVVGLAEQGRCSREVIFAVQSPVRPSHRQAVISICRCPSSTPPSPTGFPPCHRVRTRGEAASTDSMAESLF